MSNIEKKDTKKLVLKGGKILVEEKQKEIKIRKNYSLSQETISNIEELAGKLQCSNSEAIEEAVRVVIALLEEPKEEKKTTTRKAK